MPKESLGYVKLEWTCPKCGTRNPGLEKSCLSCGAPQPENVAFEAPAQQELIKDQVEIKKAQAGADIHCGFCGTRNASSNKVCSQCGADLEQGERRESGKVVGAYSTAPVKQVVCPNCGTENPETEQKCAQCGSNLTRVKSEEESSTNGSITPIKKFKSSTVVILAAVAGIVCFLTIAIVLFLSIRTKDVQGTVQNVDWTTVVNVEALKPAEYSDWKDMIPSDAKMGACSLKIHHTQEEPAPNSNKVCGTPYTVDKGSGFGEVVQDCVYEVMQDYCSYTVIEWQKIDSVELHGTDMSPIWADPQLVEGQRIGEQNQIYTIYFQTPEGQFTYTTHDSGLFHQLQPGSEWKLNINSFGNIVSIEPVE